VTPRLDPIPPKGIHLIWPMLEGRLEQLMAESHDPEPLGVVHDDLMTGKATLLASEGAVSFVICRILSNTAGLCDLHASWVWQGIAGRSAADFMPQVARWAAVHGCQRVVWESARRWERAVPGTTVSYRYSYPVGG
jgi:hypothetical protein